MKRHKLCFVISFVVTLAILATASTTLAVSSSKPSQPPGEAPYGLNVQGAASGTKLSGVIEISFTNLNCNAVFAEEYGSCDTTGPNAATARAALRLSRTNTKGENHIQAFYVNLGEVPFQDIQRVQAITTEMLRPLILVAFFGADSGQQLYLKDFSLYTQANISTAPADDRYSEFMAIANLIFAVN